MRPIDNKRKRMTTASPITTHSIPLLMGHNAIRPSPHLPSTSTMIESERNTIRIRHYRKRKGPWHQYRHLSRLADGKCVYLLGGGDRGVHGYV